jgi:alkylhydroperoxidase/carboxymuconolactone decarboxylase family protein YurZ
MLSNPSPSLLVEAMLAGPSNGHHVDMSPSRTVESILAELRLAGGPPRKLMPPALDQRTRGLVGIGAAVAMGASTQTYGRLVEDAIAGGASPTECVSALLAVASVAGVARIVAAAPRLAAALGYDVDRAIEFE